MSIDEDRRRRDDWHTRAWLWSCAAIVSASVFVSCDMALWLALVAASMCVLMVRSIVGLIIQCTPTAGRVADADRIRMLGPRVSLQDVRKKAYWE